MPYWPGSWALLIYSPTGCFPEEGGEAGRGNRLPRRVAADPDPGEQVRNALRQDPEDRAVVRQWEASRKPGVIRLGKAARQGTTPLKDSRQGEVMAQWGPVPVTAAIHRAEEGTGVCWILLGGNRAARARVLLQPVVL